MFGSNVIGRGLSLGRVLNGLSKTLSVANQVIPLYQQAKPMISKAKDAFTILKGFSTPTTQNVKQITSNVVSTKKEEMISSTNRPVFFA